MFSSMLSLLGSLRRGNFVQRSLRFRSSASAFLSRTFTSTPTTYTFSVWLKRGSLGGSGQVICGSRIAGGASTTISFTSSDAINIILGGAASSQITTTSVYRDPSAWYHLVISVTNNGNVVLYSNGVQVASAAAGSNPYLFNSSLVNTIAKQGDLAGFTFDGYLTEVNFIDGQALTPSSFGQIESTTGVWSPKQYAGSYGTNGFYLKFGNTSSVAALGTDSSGNGNTWTVNNVSLTAGATYDSMVDVPVNYSDSGNGRGNYCTLNPLNTSGIFTLSSANLNYATTSAANMGSSIGSIGISSGKWYWECVLTSSRGSFGVARQNASITIDPAATNLIYYYRFDGTKVNNGASAYGATYTTGNIIGVALDLDAGTLTFYKDGVSQGVAFSSLPADTYFAQIGDDMTSFTVDGVVNFGQRPFTYTPPTGFRALNTNNLPTPSIVNGANFMAATTYTGNAAARSLSNAVNNVSFQPDLVWIKSRTPGATNHALFDSTRGTTKYLSSDTTAAETTNANTLTAFNGDGFSLGTDTTLVNANANSYIAWQWRESITAGLDVVSYAGTGVNRTVAHNLGVAPAMVIVKRSQTGATSNWQVRHTSIPVANSIQLNSTNQATADTTVWNSTAPTSSVFSLGTSTDVNASGISYVAYCFAEIAGFSRFGSYTGNGIADGPFVFCGFRPRWVMIRKTSASGNFWTIRDTTRNTFNVANLQLYPNSAGVEGAPSAGDVIDIVSNGFKLRGISADVNDPSATYIFAAFAEVPSKYALAR